MIQIIPNWHPIFVHFIVGLFSTGFVFSLLAYFVQISHWRFRLAAEIEIVSRWCLWLAALLVIPTVLAGLYAYYTVKHDDISHIVMRTHRNFALTTGAFILLIGFWSLWRYLKQKQLTRTFILALLVTQGLLLTTAWYGAELVYRHGIGVMSMPKPEDMEHHHHH